MASIEIVNIVITNSQFLLINFILEKFTTYTKDDINKKKSYEEILGKQHKKIATKNDIKNFFCFKFGFFLSNKKNAEINKVNDIKLCNKKEYIPDGLKKLIFVFSYIIP